jgi:radical SAM protein with 4Fe4S-binding SPASM domain
MCFDGHEPLSSLHTIFWGVKQGDPPVSTESFEPRVWSRFQREFIEDTTDWRAPDHEPSDTSPPPYRAIPEPHRPYYAAPPPYSPVPYRAVSPRSGDMPEETTERNRTALPKRQSAHTLIRHEHFGASVYPSRGDIFMINHAGYALVKEIQSSMMTDPNAVQHLTGKPSWYRERAWTFFHQLRMRGWHDAPHNFTVVGGPPLRKGVLTAPNSVYVYPSLSCNLECKCSKCYVSFSNSRYKSRLMDVDRLRGIVDGLVEMGVFEIAILGGEPLSYYGLFEILEYVSGLPITVTLSTNGVLLTREVAKRLSRVVDRIQVSLDGPDPSIAESIKGEGTFDRTLEGILHLVEEHVPVVVSYVMTTENCAPSEIAAYVRLVSGLGVNSVSFLQYYPSGDQPQPERILSLDDNVRIEKVVNSLRREYPEMSIRCETGFAFLANSPSPIDSVAFDSCSGGCDCGRRRVSIYPNGDVVPCDFLAQDNRFVVGNVFATSFSRIWYDSKELNNFRDRDGRNFTPCDRCSFRPLCNGGCQALAWRINGATNSVDPRCPRGVRESATPATAHTRACTSLGR